MGARLFLAVVLLVILSIGGPVLADTTAIEDALRRHLKVLCTDIGDRTPFRPGKLRRAADYIRSVFEDSGLAVTEQGYAFEGEPVANLIATLPGAAPSNAYYLVGAHYDTVPGTPGADDNGSAVAVLLELGKRLARNPPPVPVRLVAFTLEEPPAFRSGKQGSRIFVKNLEEVGEEVLGAIVLEMVGYTTPHQEYPWVLTWAGYPDEGNFIGIIGNWASKGFGKAVLRGFQNNPRLPVESLFMPFNGRLLPATRLSDHTSFWDAGLGAVMVTDTAFFRNPHYHLPSDRPETLDYGFMAELVSSLEKALEALARGD